MREKIKEYLLKGDFEAIKDLGEPSRIVRHLISISYDKTQELAWRSIEAIGRIVYLVSKERPDFGRDLIRRLLWSIRDESGGIGWSSPEIIGEIVRNEPSRYADIPKILWSFMDEEFLRKGIIWAIGRIGEVAPEIVEFSMPFLRLIAENDSNEEIRFYALWALCKMGESPESRDVKSAVIYDKGELREITISDLRDCRSIERARELIASHEVKNSSQGQYLHEMDSKGFLITRGDPLYDKTLLRCPFCNSFVKRPYELKMGFADLLGGRCPCGALYAYDPSGRALGEILMDGLAILCEGDYNKAVSLEEGRDYLVRYFNYDLYLNRMSEAKTDLMAVRRMVFIKMLL